MGFLETPETPLHTPLILLDCPIEILRLSGYSDTLVYLFANQHCRSTFRKLLTPRCLTFNLMHTISYSSNGTYVIIYIHTCIRSLKIQHYLLVSVKLTI